MSHNLIKPRNKSLISSDLRLVLFFFFVSIAMVVSTYLFLEYKVYDYQTSQTQIAKEIITYRADISDTESAIALINKEVSIAQKISTNNIVLKDSIRNLFDLIPEDITLSRASLDSTSLILQGITPNKDTYEYLLLAPLKSIFTQSYTNFQPIGSGWYSFVSTNYLDEERDISE